MTKRELIEKLEGLPDDAEVKYIWDGHARTTAEEVWESRSGDIMIAGSGDVVYGTEERPEEAPTREEDQHWKAGDRNP